MTTTSTQRSNKIHWVMALIAMTSLMISNGMVFTGITAFDSSILAEFPEWSRSELKLREFITLALIAVSAPLIGILIDKLGVRSLMIVGCLILIPSYFAYGYVQSLMHIYIIHAFLAIVMVATGLNICVILVSNWFSKSRGTAMGIAILGSSIGGAVLTPFFGTLLSSGVDWRQGFQIASAIPLLLLLLAVFVVRSKPSEIGLAPYGQEVQKEASSNDLSSVGLTYGETLRTLSFWSIAFMAMCTFFIIMGLQSNLVLYLQDVGYSIQDASIAYTALFIPALIGKFLFGVLADKFIGKKILYANLFLLFVGLILMYFSTATTVLIPIVFIGFAWGGFYTLLQLNAVNNFGLKASGKILGTITILDAFGGGLGICLTGLIFDLSGSYDNAILVYVVLCAVAIIMTKFLKRHV